MRQENMKIRKLENELKQLQRAKDKSEEQFKNHLELAKSKLEKESSNVASLKDELKQREQQAKQYERDAS